MTRLYFIGDNYIIEPSKVEKKFREMNPSKMVNKILTRALNLNKLPSYYRTLNEALIARPRPCYNRSGNLMLRPVFEIIFTEAGDSKSTDKQHILSQPKITAIHVDVETGWHMKGMTWLFRPFESQQKKCNPVRKKRRLNNNARRPNTRVRNLEWKLRLFRSPFKQTKTFTEPESRNHLSQPLIATTYL